MQGSAGRASIDEIVASMVCLRNARAGLTDIFPSQDLLAIKARIDLCDELIDRVGEIGRNLDQLRQMQFSHGVIVPFSRSAISMTIVPQ
jgi:hypothetical protein